MSKLPTIVPDGIGMRTIADLLQELLPKKYGFTLLVFEFGDDKRMANYISNAQRKDIIEFMEETLKRFKDGTTFQTPNNN